MLLSWLILITISFGVTYKILKWYQSSVKQKYTNPINPVPKTIEDNDIEHNYLSIPVDRKRSSSSSREHYTSSLDGETELENHPLLVQIRKKQQDNEQTPMSNKLLIKPQMSSEMVISGFRNFTKQFDKRDLNNMRVVRFHENADCKFELLESIGSLVKLYIENCTNTEVIIDCKILTEHIEIYRCDCLKVRVKVRAETVQVDLSKDVQIFCDENSCKKIYHAGVQQLRICSKDTQTCVDMNYLIPDDILENGIPGKEDQFLTEIIQNELRTNRIIDTDDPLVPTTKKSLTECSIPIKQG